MTKWGENDKIHEKLPSQEKVTLDGEQNLIGGHIEVLDFKSGENG